MIKSFCSLRNKIKITKICFTRTGMQWYERTENRNEKRNHCEHFSFILFILAFACLYLFVRNLFVLHVLRKITKASTVRTTKKYFVRKTRKNIATWWSNIPSKIVKKSFIIFFRSFSSSFGIFFTSEFKTTKG